MIKKKKKSVIKYPITRRLTVLSRTFKVITTKFNMFCTNKVVLLHLQVQVNSSQVKIKYEISKPFPCVC